MRHSGSVHPVLLERPYLDRQRGRSRELASPLERRVEVGGPNDAETAEMLLAFREGAVGHEDLVTLQANHRRSARGMQPAVEDPRAGPLQLVPDGRNLAHDRCKHFWRRRLRSEEHTSELQSQSNLVCRLLLEKKQAGN